MDLTSKNIEILDSTLRDGAQGEGISFSVQDKLGIVKALCELGIPLIEAGNPGSNPKDMEFFKRVRELDLPLSSLCAFGATRRKGISADEDPNLLSLLEAGTKVAVIFGKSSEFQVQKILHTTNEENLAMIKDTLSLLKAKGLRLIYDAEHFFDAYTECKDYAMATLEAAVSGGATTLCLCDTRGGAMPWRVEEVVKDVVARFSGRANCGIHAHEDCALAVANSIIAVKAGATHVQGTLLGFGERTGNANLAAIIANLQLKEGLWCIPQTKIKELTPISRRVAEISNITLKTGMPYIGVNAFAHKAGMHIDAVTKAPEAYEHIPPEAVGNERVFLMSEVAGRSTIIDKVRKFLPDINKSSPIVATIMEEIKNKEHSGYQYEGADASFELLIRKACGKYRPFFTLHYYKTSGELPKLDASVSSSALIKVEVDGLMEVTAAEGDGPVDALDSALRKALEKFYPAVSKIRLTDYKVRVLDGKSATASSVRVLIESTDGEHSWSTCGVSQDIIEASWLSLVDSFDYKLISDMERKYRAFL